eukprot:TRINITY_DN218_c0_g2_i4.p1 TRINITY_DN218_c0_g2~~TRINITY_DN218_c0_g2_i4.p1  ORF type:complete len:1015 (-),score=243.78 TRINITY_DN218_c0_g2_i4:620-3664(-)
MSAKGKNQDAEEALYNRVSDKEANDRGLLRMSLSSTASAGLMDLGDLQNVWNRKDNLGDVDADIARVIKAKYETNKWLTYLDPELEEEFMEKFFFNSLRGHRKLIVIIGCMFSVFNIMFFITGNLVMGFIVTNFIAILASIILYFLSKTKSFRSYHLPLIWCVIIFYIGDLTAQRFFANFHENEPYALLDPGARFLNLFYFFGYYSIFMSLRLPFRLSVSSYAVIALMYIIAVSNYPTSSVLDVFENIIVMIIVVAPIASASYFYELGYRNQDARRAGIMKHTEEVVKEKGVTEKLLLNILPNKIARRLMDGEEVISDGYNHVTVLFADLVGWTDIARSMSSVEAINLLGEVVSTFDRIAHIHKVEKIKTIGDAYLVACGLPEPMPAAESAKKMANFALDMMRAVEGISTMKKRDIKLTLGIHTGPVVAGVIGKTKFLYDLWGDSVNTASRMQSHGEPACIHTTSEYFELLKDDYEFEKRPVMQVKGKGEMQTYYLKGKKAAGMVIETARTQIDDAEVTPPPTADENRADLQNDEKKIQEKKDESQVATEDTEDKKERRKRKTKEAMIKKAKEVDEMMLSQIRSKWGVLRFVSEEHEQKFRQHQDQQAQDRSLVYIGYLLAIQVLSGPDVLLVENEEENIEIYYMVMGPSIAVTAALLVLSRYLPKHSHNYGYFVSCLMHFSLLVLFGVYRSGHRRAAQFVYFFFTIYSIIAYMASQIPYRRIMKMLYTNFFFFVVVCIMVGSDLGLDNSSILIYLFIIIYGQTTATEIEKHSRLEFLLSLLADEEREKVMKQREESERLLHNILPESVITKMREGEGKLIDSYPNASVLFADVVGFTVLSSKLDARSIVTMLNSLFSQFDTLGEQLGMEKIKTIGDAYMAVCGIPYPRPDHAEVAVKMGLGMIKIVQDLPDIEGLRVNMRIGVHSGPVVGGLVGLSKMVRNKAHYTTQRVSPDIFFHQFCYQGSSGYGRNSSGFCANPTFAPFLRSLTSGAKMSTSPRKWSRMEARDMWMFRM